MTRTALLFSEDTATRREATRRSVDAESTLRGPGGRAHAVLLRDLSADGCLIEIGLALALAPGDIVSIGLPGAGRYASAVTRTDGRLVGCRFEAPLNPSDFARAFRAPVVVNGAFAGDLPLPPLTEPAVEKWHASMRIAFMVGVSGVLWFSLFELVRGFWA